LLLAATSSPGALLSITGLTGPVSSPEINSFITYIQTQSPPPTPWGALTGTGHNDWADGTGGRDLEAMGDMFIVSSNMTILDTMISWADNCASQRNDLMSATNGGQRVMWTGLIDKVWCPNWPTDPTDNQSQYCGCETEDVIGHLAFCAKLILQSPGIWTLAVPDGDPYGYGATYWQRATNYLAKCDDANNEYFLKWFIQPGTSLIVAPTNAAWVALNENVNAINRQMMFTSGFQRLAEAHELLGDNPSLAAEYNTIVQATVNLCLTGMVHFDPYTVNGQPVYDWGYYPTTDAPETTEIHAEYDIIGIWRAFNNPSYGITLTPLVPFANTMADVIYLGTNTFAGNVAGSGGIQSPIYSGWLWTADWNPQVYNIVAGAAYTNGWYSGSPDIDAAILFMKNRRYLEFSLTPATASQSIEPGAAAPYTLAITPMGGFSNTVNLAVTGLPPGATASFSPPTVNCGAMNFSSSNVAFSVQTSDSTPAGSYTLSVIGSSGAVFHTNTVSLAVETGAIAQGITWGTNVTVSGDSDVFTNGTLLYAYDWAGTNNTVNGIAFTGASGSNAGNAGISGIGSYYQGFKSTSQPFAGLSAAYRSILAGGEYASTTNLTATVTLNGLTVGHSYAVQIWVNDPRANGGEAGRTEIAAGVNQVTLAYNVPPTPGGVGQYSIGVFTAVSSGQTFTLLSNGSSGSTQLNALLVSDVTATGYQPANPAPPGQLPSAQWVHFGTNGLLSYYSDNLGNHLPDFSYAGYMEGGVPLPVVPVNLTISPVAGDNTASIQDAINTVSAIPPDTNGFRGAVLLNPGVYTVAGTLSISAGGVVLRGSGDNTNTGTVLLVIGASRTVITVGGSGSWTQTGGAYSIADSYVPLGATNLHINGGITWGTNVTISSDSDVFTNGTLLYAYDWANVNTTVKGVAFTGTASANPGNVSISGIGSYYGGYTSSATPFSALSSTYRGILTGGEYGGSVVATVTLNNLTVGHTYAVQVWVSDPRGGGTAGRTGNALGYNQTILAYNVPPATGGVGQFSIGVFTAAGSTQTFSLSATNSGGSTQLNALLVSDVTATGYQPVNPSTSSLLNVGDTIIIQRPQTQPWINAIGMNTLTNPWTAGTGLQFERQVTAINGNQISFDAPLCNPIESAWTTGLVYQVTDSGRIQQDGIENLCGIGQISDYPTNILNGVFITYQNIKNSWIKDVLLAGWGNAININDKWCTVQDCLYTNPATSSAEDAPAAFTFGGSGAQSLFQRCTSDGGYYHIMVTQGGTPGPNVFLNFNCSGTHYNGGPHQRWAAGALHDNIYMAPDSEGAEADYTPYLAVNNRGNDGSGQGWGAGFSVMYNCVVPEFYLEQPDTTTNEYNWTIGGIGAARSYSDDGIYDTLGSIVTPHSLYLEQLRERLGPAALENIGYAPFALSAAPLTQSIAPGNAVSFTVNVTATNYFDDTVSLSVSGLPSNSGAIFSANSIAGSGVSTLIVTASNSVAPGQYTLTISARDGNLALSTNVNFTVISSAPPIFGPVNFNGSALVMTGSNGNPGASYYLLATTNLALPIMNWTVLSTNTFDGAGNFSFTNTAPTGPQQYFMLRLQ
jgi:hypothetical protein